MKSIGSLIIFIFLTSATVKGQQKQSRNNHDFVGYNLLVAPEIGLNLSTYRFSFTDYSYKPGLRVGMLLMAGGKLQVSFAPHYSGEGASYFIENILSSGTFENSIRLHYFRIPVKGHLVFGSFNVGVGPTTGYLAAVREESHNVTQISPNEFLIEKEISRDKNDYNQIDVGPTASIGFRKPLTKRSIFLIDLHYYYGLRQVYKHSSIYNQSLSLTGALSF